MNTAQDVVDYLITAVGGGPQDGEHKAIRQAVVHGVREIMQLRQWLWHTRTGSFVTDQISTTASVTNGSKNIVVANNAGFVPGRIADISAQVFPNPAKITAVNGNTVTLDVAAMQTMSGVVVRPQTYYDLPPDVKDIDALTTNTVGTLHCYITPQEWQRLEINTRGAGEPYYYTIMRSDLYPDRYQVRFVGVPTDRTVVNYTYRYIPKAIKYMGYELLCRVGTVSAAGTTVTGVETEFPEDAAGCVIRFGTTSTEADPVGSLSPFIHERKILSRGSMTSLVVDSAVTVPALTKYSISDIIDASPQMYTAILSSCEMWYARIAGKSAEAAIQMFNRDVRLAMENDVVSPMSGQAKNMRWPTPRSMGWHSDLEADIG